MVYLKKLEMGRKDNGQIMDHEIKIQCCYPDCQKDMGSKMGGNKPGMISHGICPECMEKHYSEYVKEEK